MSVREYIGARYVPLFMGDWDITADYEPLSIVQHLGNSYTSRQSVPHGIAITNELYWAETGNYNAQVEAYRQEVLTFDGRIDDLEDKFPVQTSDIANGAVTTQKIADGAINYYKLENEAVTTAKIKDGDVTTAKLADSSVTSAKIADGAVNTDELAYQAVTTQKIADGAINYYKLENEAVTTAKIKDGDVTTAKLADSSVTLAKLSSAVQKKFEKHAVIVGDSWSTTDYGVAESHLWWNTVCKQLGVTPHNYSVSGMGYQAGIVNFPDKLITARDDTSFDNDTVEWVFLFGSLNDASYYSANQSAYTNVVSSTIAYAKSYFPKARIIVIGTQNPYNALRARTNMSIVQRSVCEQRGVSFICMVWLTLGLDEMTDPDQAYHPTQAGQYLIASWVMNHLNGGTPILPNRDFEMTNSENVRIAGTPKILLRGNVLYLEAAGSSTEGSVWGSLEFANSILQSLEYFNTYLNGHSLAGTTDVWAIISTTNVQFRDGDLRGTTNNGWYYGAISWLY